MNASDVQEHKKKDCCVKFSSSKAYYVVYMQYGNYYTYVNKVKKEIAKNSPFTKISKLKEYAQKTGNIYKVLDKNGNNVI
jgi:negative regulator of genetic competence, sporulation and motility